MSQDTNVQKKKIVIVGGGVAGMTLAMALTKKKGNFQITVIKKEAIGSYSPCGMPFVMEGKVEYMEDIILKTTDFYRGRGIELKTESEATDLDLDNQQVTLNSGEVLDYDILVIATGRKPFIPPIEGVELDGVYTLSNYEEGNILNEAMMSASNAVIIGAGIIGLETAVAFVHNRIKTTVIEMLPSIVPQILDFDMAEIIQRHLKTKGIKIYCSTRVSSIKGEKTVSAVATDEGEFPADLVLIATGVKPNSDLVQEAGLAVGKSGGVVVNPTLNVEREGQPFKNVFALGDCVEVRDQITSTPKISALASTAALHARMIAENISGGDLKIKGYLSPSITVIGDLQVGSVGLTSHMANQSRLEVNIGRATGQTRSSYYPDNKLINIKLLAHDNLLVGAQIISEEDVKERINAIALAIKNKMTISELLFTERCFTPPLSLLTDPFIRALESFEQQKEKVED
ncbi:MAG: FAD-dependent oxidoreductase [Thermoplasmata archaeon]|nr:MAG: FAD-dependent oxidoreductase [Thermoplasmata archaeon]